MLRSPKADRSTYLMLTYTYGIALGAGIEHVRTSRSLDGVADGTVKVVERSVGMHVHDYSGRTRAESRS
ncbi:hypothetical protein AB0C11_17635 [Streptomyces sp. NPDC039016]|uniref:hypothetical protein n=1 Tax=Streptomyces sp. NPDC039016 TaxID=3154330 RepID=UPI0033E47396